MRKISILFLILIISLGLTGLWTPGAVMARPENPGLILPGEEHEEKTRQDIPDTQLEKTTEAGEEKTALMLAARDHGAAAIKSLLEEDARINARDENGWTPLMYAAKHNDAVAVKTLLEAGAQVNVQNKLGWTALMYATYFNDAPAIKTLLEAGADVEIQEKKYGITALDIANQRNEKEINDIFQQFTNQKINSPAKALEPYEYMGVGAARWRYENDDIKVTATGKQFNSGIIFENLALEAQLVSGGEDSNTDTGVKLRSGINLRVMPTIQLPSLEYAWFYGSIGLSHAYFRITPTDPAADRYTEAETDVSYGAGAIFGTDYTGLKLDWTYYNRGEDFDFSALSLTGFLTF